MAPKKAFFPHPAPSSRPGPCASPSRSSRTPCRARIRRRRAPLQSETFQKLERRPNAAPEIEGRREDRRTRETLVLRDSERGLAGDVMRRVCWISLPRDHVEAAVGYGRDASLVVVRVGGPVVHQREVVGPAIGVHRDEVRHGGQAREVGDRGTGALAVGVRRQRLDAGRRPHPIPASPRRPQKINRSRRAWVLEEEEEDGDDDGEQRERCPSFFAVRQTPTDAPVTPATKVAAVGADGVGLVRVVQLPVQTAADHAGDEHHGMARGLGQRIEATARVESARALPKAAGVVAALGACAPLPAVTRARPHLVEQEQEQRPHGGWGAAHRHEPRSRVLRCSSEPSAAVVDQI